MSKLISARQGGGAFASRSSDEFTSEEDLGRAYTTNNLSTVEGQAAVMKVISDFDLEFGESQDACTCRG